MTDIRIDIRSSGVHREIVLIETKFLSLDDIDFMTDLIRLIDRYNQKEVEKA